jgi:hypothetical protein
LCVELELLIYPLFMKYLKKLVGNTEIEDRLQKLDKLTPEEVCMSTRESHKKSTGVCFGSGSKQSHSRLLPESLPEYVNDGDC